MGIYALEVPRKKAKLSHDLASSVLENRNCSKSQALMLCDLRQGMFQNKIVV